MTIISSGKKILSTVIKRKIFVNKILCQQQKFLHLAPPFLVEDYEPIAIKTMEKGLFPDKMRKAKLELEKCNMCPRNCGVNRSIDKRGICNTGLHAIVSSVFPHFGEESVLQGWNGSGSIFFSMCNMRCVFCQNWDISQKKPGKKNQQGWTLSADEIADLMIKLQNETKCHNINLVTPEHNASQLVEAICIAVEQKGLNIPIVYNTSSYDSMTSLELMDGLVDIYMPDFKFWNCSTAKRLAKTEDYPIIAKDTIKEMYRQVGDLIFDHNGIAKRGLLLRHLMMPGLENESKLIMEWISKEISKDCYIHLMEQYKPDFKVGDKKKSFNIKDKSTFYEEIDRPVNKSEMENIQLYAREQGLWRFEEPRNW